MAVAYFLEAGISADQQKVEKICLLSKHKVCVFTTWSRLVHCAGSSWHKLFTECIDLSTLTNICNFLLIFFFSL